jgi:hypothetical protein
MAKKRKVRPSAFAFVEPPPKSKTLKQISKEYARGTELDAIIAEIDAGPDRATAILSSIQDQDALGTLIRGALKRDDDATMKELEGQGCPFGSFYSMIILGYAMGLIDADEKKTLNIIRDVRNAFAHARKPISFRTPEVISECKKLENPKGHADMRDVYVRANFRLARDLLLRTVELSLGKPAGGPATRSASSSGT